MIDTLITFILNGYTYIKKHPQLLMTLLLIIVIPIAFLVSGQQFLNAARGNQETLEKDRIGMLHDVLGTFITVVQVNQSLVQREIERIKLLNPDIIEFSIGKEEGVSVKILASIATEEINSNAENPDLYRTSNISPSSSLIFSSSAQGVRYWHGYRLVRAESGEHYYIYTKTSLAHIDALFASRIQTAYIWLLGILAVVLLLVVRHVRLIDYAYLYSETKKANEMKDLFTNMIAHELRAPLTAMRGYASMIREKQGVEPEIQKNATNIETAAGRLVLIVSDLLDVARIHSGKLAVNNARTNIHPLINSVIDALQVSAHEKSIQISGESISDVYINVDEKRLHQALTNLVSNSIKYTKAGKILVSLQEKNDRIEIRVKDTGMGISAENQKNLFAPFFRVENAEVSATVGTGLGMWITKQLIELMRGSIAVESIQGVGTHIVVTLPK